MKCKFCDEPKGIMIYTDRGDEKRGHRQPFIGWAHLGCIWWHPDMNFTDE